MSIILKALKKAEESKAGQETIRRARTYQSKAKNLQLTILAGIAVGILLIFVIGVYMLKIKSVSKPSVKPIDKIVAVKPKAVTETKEKPAAVVQDMAKLHEDAIVQIKDKNYSSAEGILRKGLAAKPDDAVLHNNLGFALKNQFKYKEAASEYERAIQLKPDYHEAMNNLAVTYELLGDKEKAKSFYQKALSVKPSYAEAHLNYALLLESGGNISEAESHYHTFLNLSTDATLKSSVKERLRGIKK